MGLLLSRKIVKQNTPVIITLCNKLKIHVIQKQYAFRFSSILLQFVNVLMGITETDIHALQVNVINDFQIKLNFTKLLPLTLKSI